MSELPDIPADVAWSRGVRFHLHAVFACAGAVVVLSVLGGAAILMAGPLAQDPPITAGILALCVGGLVAIAGAVAAGIGQLRVLQAARAGSAAPLQTVAEILAATRGVFNLLPRVAVAGCVALLAAYSIGLPGGIWGAVVGSFVVVQVALVLTLVRRSVLSEERLLRRA